jgi:hypothetical protein
MMKDDTGFGSSGNGISRHVIIWFLGFRMDETLYWWMSGIRLLTSFHTGIFRLKPKEPLFSER